MTQSSPITFDTRAGRSLALMGVVQVGVVWLESDRCADAWWIVTLPDVNGRARRAASIDEAKERLTSKVAEWLEAARLVPAATSDNADNEAVHER